MQNFPLLSLAAAAAGAAVSWSKCTRGPPKL